jgi:lipopolysaccharide transport system ATP-binding protein
MTTAVEISSVTKKFLAYSQYHAGFKALVLNPRSLWTRGQRERFVAIDRLSFSIAAGETFGILGRNGAGKSTLLGLIGGILRPNQGVVTVRGRVCPLLELGVGFTPELTGRENVIINGVLLGLRRHEIEAKADEIIAFSGLRQFIYQPLKTFSSGMQVRLGFSIAVHAEPDILLVDEVLAVGDAEFQAKCLERIGELRRQGVTIVFVSHDLPTVEAICDRVAWIDRGRLCVVGSPKEVIALYREEVNRRSSHSAGEDPVAIR